MKSHRVTDKPAIIGAEGLTVPFKSIGATARKMEQLFWIIGVLGAYIAMQLWILPKLGIST